jgi:hypothetical protein
VGLCAWTKTIKLLEELCTNSVVSSISNAKISRKHPQTFDKVDVTATLGFLFFLLLFF